MDQNAHLGDNGVNFITENQQLDALLDQVEDRLVMNLFLWLPFLTGITITKETNCAETGEQLQGNKVVILQKEYPLGTSGERVYQEKLLQLCRK